MTADLRPARIGIDVGGTKILALLLDPADEVVLERRLATPPDGDGLVAALVEVTSQLVDAAPGAGCRVEAIGVGMMGLIDRMGTMRFAPNLPGVVEVAIGPRLADGIGLPVVVDNDATCALRGEHALGAVRGVADAVLVAFGTGIGAGILLDGTIVRGANGFAGEAGHMVVQRDGVPCPCGRRGCWERYASGTGLGRFAREAAEAGRAPRLVALAGGDPLDVRGEHVTRAAAEGDPVALELVGEFADWAGLGIVNLTQLLDVTTVVIGGGMAESAGVLLEPIRRSVARRQVAPEHRPPVAVIAAMLGERAGAIGAALLARPGADRAHPGGGGTGH
ncbi:MAG TPA: ROK family protein [Acidimicrobiales bacterium]